ATAQNVSTGLIVYADPPWYSPDVGHSRIFTMKPNGSNPTALTDATGNQFPAWSRDGKKIAFTSVRTGIFQVWSMDADGSNQIQLTNQQYGVVLPSWSPDGRIEFIST